MISDVLFDAREDILRCLKNFSDRFTDEETRLRIAEVVLAMDKVRLNHGFDVPPNYTPPTFPTDALTYLDTLLAEKAAERRRRVEHAEWCKHQAEWEIANNIGS